MLSTCSGSVGNCAVGSYVSAFGLYTIRLEEWILYFVRSLVMFLFRVCECNFFEWRVLDYAEWWITFCLFAFRFSKRCMSKSSFENRICWVEARVVRLWNVKSEGRQISWWEENAKVWKVVKTTRYDRWSLYINPCKNLMVIDSTSTRYYIFVGNVVCVFAVNNWEHSMKSSCSISFLNVSFFWYAKIVQTLVSVK